MSSSYHHSILPVITKMPLTTIITTLFLSLTTIIAADPTVTFTPATLSKPGDTVTVTWSGITNPSKLDWLGIYSPPESPHHQFIGYFFLSNSSSYLSGSGSLTFPLINLRTPYTFRIFRWTESEINPKKTDHDKNPLPQVKHLLGESGVLKFENVDSPQQVHLSFTDRYDEMRVMFVTASNASRFVRWGLKENQMDGVVGTSVVKYGVEDMCDSPANQSIGWRDPGFIHDGVMRNLSPGVRYFYKVGSDGDWSPTYSFISRNDDSDETIAFIFGDMGTATPYHTFIRTQDESSTTVKWILRDLEGLGEKSAFVSHIGDISYARGYAWIWDNFFNQIEPIASQVAYHVCIGNHEYDWPLQPWKPDWAAYGTDGGGECGVPYSLRFKMPGNSSFATANHAPATQNLYYSMDVGVVHFVYISTETNFLLGSAQYNFLKNDLENVDRKKTPFVVVQGHRPMYTTSNEVRDSPLRDKMVEHLEPLLVKNNVTLALWGHVHRYERFCPLSNYTCGTIGAYGEKQGGYPVHAVIGMAGQDWQPIWEPRPDHTDMPVFPQPRRSLYRGGEFGYTRLVATREKLKLSYVGNHDGEVHDMVELWADGEAVSGGRRAADPVEILNDKDELKSRFGKSFISQFVKGASVLVLGVLAGYIMGFVSRGRRETPKSGKSWIPVKTEES